MRTRNVFSESTANLYETVLSSALYDCAAKAALAMDIMDRNLYERANDCRWWALTGTFRELLAGGQAAGGRERLTAVLRTINRLYTVYTNLIVFDAAARVVAVSNPAYTELIGQTLAADWVRETLVLPDTQRYCVSPYAPTYVYAAAIRTPGDDACVVGGIAIVFDAAPQFVAMLQDALPRREDGGIVDGAFAVFAERDGRILASADAELQPGTRRRADRGAGSAVLPGALRHPGGAVGRSHPAAPHRAACAGRGQQRAQAAEPAGALSGVQISRLSISRVRPSRAAASTTSGS